MTSSNSSARLLYLHDAISKLYGTLSKLYGTLSKLHYTLSTVIPAPSSVIPAKAGIPLSYESRRQKRDPRLRGDDELRGLSEGEET